MSKTSNEYGVGDNYWNRLDDRSRAMYDVVRPLRKSVYSVQFPIYRIEGNLSEFDQDAKSQGGELNLCPDFQRGHVWSQEKQVAFIEAVVRGTAPMVIRFNSPGWNGRERSLGKNADLNPHDVLCIDGLQRLTAMRDFVAGKIKIFEGHTIEDMEGTPFSFKRIGMNWTMEMFDIPNRADLLQFYLDLNSGGVVHSPEELEKVGKLLEEAKTAPGPDPAGGKTPKKKTPKV